MTKKYIIKNCPAFCDVDDDWDCISRDTEELKCQNHTDCLLKQIVEKCREEIRTNDRWSDSRAYAIETLQMLEIEECEE